MISRLSQEDAARLYYLAEQWVRRAVAVHAGKRPCNVKDFKSRFEDTLASITDSEGL